MSLSGINIVGSARADGSDRAENDYYATNPIAIDGLFDKIQPKNKTDIIWEPCVGEGNLSNRCREYGYQNIIESDMVVNRPNTPKGTIEYDFLASDMFQENVIDYNKVQWLITNPPYNCAMEFVNEAISKLNMYNPVENDNPKRICFVLKTVFLESAVRYNFFSQHKLFSDLFVFSKRLGCYKNNIVTGTGVVSYSWFIFTQAYEGKPKIDWILK